MQIASNCELIRVAHATRMMLACVSLWGSLQFVVMVLYITAFVGVQ
jgi:hypothetical protein